MGKKRQKGQETRNQARKRAYAKLSEALRQDGSKRAAKGRAAKNKRATRTVSGDGSHNHYCGNHACLPCRSR